MWTPQLLRTPAISALNACMDDGRSCACHDLSDGGMAVALAEMCIGGDIGAGLDLSEMGLRDLTALFTESNTRWLVEVDKGREEEFVQRLGVPALRIGEVGGDELSDR